MIFIGNQVFKPNNKTSQSALFTGLEFIVYLPGAGNRFLSINLDESIEISMRFNVF